MFVHLTRAAANFELLPLEQIKGLSGNVPTFETAQRFRAGVPLCHIRKLCQGMCHHYVWGRGGDGKKGLLGTTRLLFGECAVI